MSKLLQKKEEKRKNTVVNKKNSLRNATILKNDFMRFEKFVLENSSRSERYLLINVFSKNLFYYKNYVLYYENFESKF